MPARRTIHQRHQRRRISPEAVELFKRLRASTDDVERRALHNQLHDALQCQPWEFGIALPDEPPSHPHMQQEWTEAQNLYILLANAAR